MTSPTEQQFFDGLIEAIRHYLLEGTDTKKPVLTFVPPTQLREKIDITLSDTGKNPAALLRLCKQIMEMSVATANPYFFNQLYTGADIYGMLGDFLSSVLNTSMATYEIAPVFSHMEQEIFACMAKKTQREPGTYQGLMLAWGSLSILYALMAARFHFFPHVIEEGMYGLPQLAIFTSDQGHYAIPKSAATLWLGKKNIHTVPTDASGSMIPEALEKAILLAKEQWLTPFFVNATAWTTVLGAFDPIERIAELCKKHTLRLHVDASRGGAALFTSTHRQLLDGIQHADSYNFNPHKALRAPQQCSIFMIQKPGLLQQCNAYHSTYYFQKDKAYDTSFDTGDCYIQCARKNDILKLRLILQAHGLQWVQKNLEWALSLAAQFTQKVLDHPHFFLYQHPAYLNVCFRWLPPHLRTDTDLQTILDHKETLHHLTAALKAQMLHDGTMIINHQPFKEFPNCIRQVFIRPDLDEHDLDAILHNLDKRGEAARNTMNNNARLAPANNV